MRNNEAPLRLPPEALTAAPINWMLVKWWQAEHPDMCIYCHTQLTDENRTRDHILSKWWLKYHVPFSFRTKFGEMNIAPCCAECNKWKGNRNAHEWPEFKQLPGRDYLLLKKNAFYSSIYEKFVRIFVA